MDRNIEAPALLVRDATSGDVASLTRVGSPRAIHADRVRQADEFDLHYLVVLADDTLIGFGLIVFGWPETWPPHDHPDRLPVMIDLVVDDECRSRGAGTAMIDHMEQIAAARGCEKIHVSVNPGDNPRAQALYLRLGYEIVDPEPYLSKWEFTDSDGEVHSGEEWIIDLVKRLG